MSRSTPTTVRERRDVLQDALDEGGFDVIAIGDDKILAGKAPQTLSAITVTRSGYNLYDPFGNEDMTERLGKFLGQLGLRTYKRKK